MMDKGWASEQDTQADPKRAGGYRCETLCLIAPFMRLVGF